MEPDRQFTNFTCAPALFGFICSATVLVGFVRRNFGWAMVRRLRAELDTLRHLVGVAAVAGATSSALIRPANCKSEDGRLFVGDVKVRGMEDGGWYWLSGPSGGPPAVVPLVRSRPLDEDVEPVEPGNPDVTIHRGRHGTLFKHATVDLSGVVPHIED